MREPKFVPGERVAVRGVASSEYDIDETTVTATEFVHGRLRGTGNAHSGWCYKTDHQPDKFMWFMEDSLRKLPPETPATFDASIWAPNKESVK